MKLRSPFDGIQVNNANIYKTVTLMRLWFGEKLNVKLAENNVHRVKPFDSLELRIISILQEEIHLIDIRKRPTSIQDRAAITTLTMFSVSFHSLARQLRATACVCECKCVSPSSSSSNNHLPWNSKKTFFRTSSQVQHVDVKRDILMGCVKLN